MGNCISAGSVEVSDEDKRKHKEAEKSMKEVRIQFPIFSLAYMSVLIGCADRSVHRQAKQKMASQVKVRRDRSQL